MLKISVPANKDMSMHVFSSPVPAPCGTELCRRGGCCHDGSMLMDEYFFTPAKGHASPYINHFLQPDSIISDYTNPQTLNRYSYVGNRPVNFNDPTGHCPENEVSCRNRLANTLPKVSGSTPKPEGLSKEGNDAWNGLQNLGLLGNEQGAMEYVTASECTPYTCTIPQLPAAMMHRYNEFCSGGAWSTECVESFWGYMQGVLTADTTKLGTGTDYTDNLAAAILGNPQNSDYATYTNDGQGCENNNLCGWGNFTPDQASKFRNQFFGSSCPVKDNGDHCNLYGPESSSVWIHYQEDTDQYFIVMDFDVDTTYCGSAYNWCER